MTEQMNIMMYMVENGYFLGPMTIEEAVEGATVEEVWSWCNAFMAWKERQQG